MTEKIYRKIIKNRKNKIIFIIVLTLLASLPVFIFPGIKKGDDVFFHLSRISAIRDNIKNLQIFKGIYPGYFNGYGYANGLFYPDIFLYVPALLTTLGMNVIISYKIFLILINLFTILSIFIAIKNISNNDYATILGSILYAFAPYRLVDMYERGALGETLAFIFIPIIIYGMYEIIFRDKRKYYILVIGMTGLILSHMVSTYIITILLIIYCIFNTKQLFKEKRILYLLLSATITLLITSFFIVPMIEQMLSQKFYYNNTSNIPEFVLSNRTVPIYLLFIGLPNFRRAFFKKYWVPSGIGIIFIYIIIKKIKHKEINDKFINQSVIISIITLLLTTLTPFWKLNIVKKILFPIQFPWRLYMIPTVLLTISGSIILEKTNKIKTIRNIFIMSTASVLSMFAICIIPKRITEVKEYDASYAEYLPKEIDKEFIKQRELIISNNPLEYTLKQIGTDIEISFKQNDMNTEIELPLIYYKGYESKMENKKLETFKTKNGLVGIKINDIKEGNIKTSYKGTIISKTTKIISLITLISFVYITKERNKIWNRKDTIYYHL